uniref:Uncharacterized protein n=1 Tax=Oreochromis niloticus TaxID=8128 RepID=A0A669BVK4_ORENI
MWQSNGVGVLFLFCFVFCRRGPNRSTRRKREDEQKPVPVPEAKASHPKFDLAASNFPPLPGSVVSMQEESVPEMRLSDIVPPVTKENVSSSAQAHTQSSSEHAPSTCSQALSTETPSSPPTSPTSPTSEPVRISFVLIITLYCVTSAYNSPNSACFVILVFFFCFIFLNCGSLFFYQGLKKLSYAEVCQKLAKEPLPAQIQPLQELKVNRVEEPRPNGRQTAEKRGDKRPPRQPLRSFRGGSGQARVREPGQKIREHQKGLNTGKRFSPQRAARRSGKEQNIPPSSPK